jgi:hypothetical protein
MLWRTKGLRPALIFREWGFEAIEWPSLACYIRLAEAECRSARNVRCEVICRLRSEAFASATALLEGLLECSWAESWGVRIEGGL